MSSHIDVKSIPRPDGRVDHCIDPRSRRKKQKFSSGMRRSSSQPSKMPMAFPSRLVKSMSLFPAAARSAAASCAQPFHPRSTAANLFVCRLPKAIGFLLVAATLIGTTATADAQLQASEPALTAAYLEKFAGFVECPPGTFKTDTAPIVIGVVDADAVRDQLAEVARDRFLGKRVIEVARRGQPVPADATAHAVRQLHRSP